MTPADTIRFMSPYPGPLRQEPLAIELLNTAYAVGGTLHDGLIEAAGSWLEGLGERLPGGSGPDPSAHELAELRDVVRDALQATIDGSAPELGTLDALNRASARAPHSRAVERDGGRLVAVPDYGDASRADIVIATLAADAIELITGPRRADVRACGAPSCVLLFLKDHPRREWCSNVCGNRARQARHYARRRR
jgi:predicted RNA-binding Zn ribbon-like protein